jgi:hypothetical protein
MPFHLIRIRLLQSGRLLKELGLYSILIIAAFIISVYASRLVFNMQNGAFLLSGVILLSCLSIQSIRNDLHFVSRHLQQPYLEIYSEYALMILPFASAALLTANWYFFFVLFAGIAFIPLYKPVFRQRTMFRKLGGRISPQDFEWISGIRRMYLYIFPLYVIAIFFCWLKILPLILMWIITTLVVSFYEEGESLQVLRSARMKPQAFLLYKIRNPMLYLLFLFMPILAVNCIFNPDFLIVNLIFIASQLSLACFGIIFKYAMYVPGSKMRSNSIISGFVSMASIIPFFMPVPVIMTIVYYFKARKNLNPFLHA